MPAILRRLALLSALALAGAASARAQDAPAAPKPYTPPSAAPKSAPASEAPPAEAAAPAPAATGAGADAAETAGSLSPLIEDVQVVGPWTDGDRSGVWRTVMMRIPGSADTFRFFVQQVETVKDAPTVLSTTEITEVAAIKGEIVGLRADEPSADDPTGLSLFFDIIPSDGEISETYELHYFKDQPYSFGPASN